MALGKEKLKSLLLKQRDDYYPILLISFGVIGFVYILQRHWGFFVDDTFITFRYINNFLAGKGLVYNPSEMVEGYSNFLFLMLTALLTKLGSAPLLATRIINISFSIFIILFSSLYVYKTAAKSKKQMLITALAFFMMSTAYPFIVWQAGGLESPLFAGLVLIGTILTLQHLEGNKSLKICFLAGTVFALACLTRPDGLLFVVIAGFFLKMHSFFPLKKINLKPAFAFGLPIIILVGSHILWRHSYYGEWLPNTYYAKVYGLTSAATFHKGLNYLSEFITSPPYLLIWTAVCLPFAFDKKHRSGNLMLITMMAAFILYIARIGGDWMMGYRFLTPLILLAILFTARVHINRLEGISQKNMQLLVFGIISISLSQPFSRSYRAIMSMTTATSNWQSVAEYINANWPKDSLIGINMAGYIPYSTPDYRYLDMLGLNDKTIARRKDFPEGWTTSNAGHSKGDGAYVLSRKPDYIIADAGFENDYIEKSPYLSEKEMLASGKFYDLYEEKTVDLTPTVSNENSINYGKKRKMTFVFYKLKSDDKKNAEKN